MAPDARPLCVRHVVCQKTTGDKTLKQQAFAPTPEAGIAAAPKTQRLSVLQTSISSLAMRSTVVCTSYKSGFLLAGFAGVP